MHCLGIGNIMTPVKQPFDVPCHSKMYFPFENMDVPASYVSIPEVNRYDILFHLNLAKVENCIGVAT